jgi:hypothetical protein
MGDSDFLFKILVPGLSALFGMGAFYGAVRADIKYMVGAVKDMKGEIERVRDNATKAHERIDQHIMNYHKG